MATADMSVSVEMLSSDESMLWQGPCPEPPRSGIGGDRHRHRRHSVGLDILYDAGLLEKEPLGDERRRGALHLGNAGAGDVV